MANLPTRVKSGKMEVDGIHGAGSDRLRETKTNCSGRSIAEEDIDRKHYTAAAAAADLQNRIMRSL